MPAGGKLRKLSSKSKLVIAAGVGSVVLVVGFLPLLFLTLPNPEPVLIPGLEGERVGTYIALDNGLYKLYPYTAPAASFPEEAISVDSGPRIFVKYRQLEALSIYGIRTWSGNEEIQVNKDTSNDNVLEMTPESDLAPGEYYIVAARDGIYGGIDYFYFRVEGGGAAGEAA